MTASRSVNAPSLSTVKLEPLAFADFVHVGNERIGRIVFLAALYSEMQLPEVQQAGRIVNNLPGGGRAAFAGAVVHNRHARMNRMDEWRRVGAVPAVVGDQENVHRADLVRRADQAGFPV